MLFHLQFTGISSVGAPVRYPDPVPDLSGIARHLALSGTGYLLKDVRRLFSQRIGHMTDAQRASAYILHLLGCTMFVDKSQDKVPAAYLSLCMDLDRLPTLSWGSATLAYLYRELGKASRSGCKQMGGCATLLEVHLTLFTFFLLCRPPLCNYMLHLISI